MTRKTKQPDPKTADRVEYRDPSGTDFISRVVRVQGWYSYTDMGTGEKVLVLSK